MNWEVESRIWLAYGKEVSAGPANGFTSQMSISAQVMVDRDIGRWTTEEQRRQAPKEKVKSKL